jgi:hypothetical protein
MVIPYLPVSVSKRQILLQSIKTSTRPSNGFALLLDNFALLFINSPLTHMKRILISGIAAIVVMLFMSGCETDPNSSSSVPEIRPMAASQADANPAIVYKTQVTTKGKTYGALAVMDSNGANQTTIYTPSSTSHHIGVGPSWLPGGGGIAFILYSSDNSISHSIYLRDVSVVRGKATGSNTRVLISASTGGFRSVSGSSLSSTAQIAYTTQSGSPAIGTVQVISTSGGTPTVLYQSPDKNETHFYSSVTWSPDDEKIAFIDRTHSSGIDTLRVIDASTGALLETIALGVTNWTDIEWSRSGANQLAMSVDYGSGHKIYYVTPTTGSTPTTNNVSGKYPTWSPNNSSVVTWLPGSIQKTVAGMTTTSTLATSATSSDAFPRWKR